MLLDAGAEPTDGESVFHAAERFHERSLELLLAYGADLNLAGDWGNTPLYFLLRYWDVEQSPRVKQGLVWLLDHGADPGVRCGEERENALHVAVRRGQHPDVVHLLLERGVDVNARRGDGRTAWLLARRGGHDQLVSLLEQAGAEPEPLSRADELMLACARGDADGARRLATPELVATLAPADLRILPEAAARGAAETVQACLAAGFPIDTADEQRATALHHAAIHGRAPLVRELLRHGADLHLRDREHDSPPLGWACFGADYVADPEGDYVDTVRALLEAGAPSAGHRAAHRGVREALGLEARE
jgi:ankyrin repeat protein